ncbi:hypothetical protein [Aquisphaera giovannonii]|uniref:hypothetical protein n=1 Tax=Aquisphaera giovannonii TaxID=406548 RepID=UPI0011DF901D|nr:hypothetical protein [Aquisphaera giovannonii]
MAGTIATSGCNLRDSSYVAERRGERSVRSRGFLSSFFSSDQGRKRRHVTAPVVEACEDRISLSGFHGHHIVGNAALRSNSLAVTGKVQKNAARHHKQVPATSALNGTMVAFGGAPVIQTAAAPVKQVPATSQLNGTIIAYGASPNVQPAVATAPASDPGASSAPVKQVPATSQLNGTIIAYSNTPNGQSVAPPTTDPIQAPATQPVQQTPPPTVLNGTIIAY